MWDGVLLSLPNYKVASGRELFIHGKGMCSYQSTVGLILLSLSIFLTLHQKPILQLVDNSTYGIVALPLYKEFPASGLSFFRSQYYDQLAASLQPLDSQG